MRHSDVLFHYFIFRYSWTFVIRRTCIMKDMFRSCVTSRVSELSSHSYSIENYTDIYQMQIFLYTKKMKQQKFYCASIKKAEGLTVRDICRSCLSIMCTQLALAS